MLALWLALSWGADDGLLGCAGEATEQQRMRCVYMAARRTGAFDEAEAILREREGPWASLNLANTVAARGGDVVPLYEAAVAAFADGPAEGAVKGWLGLRTAYDRANRPEEVDRALGRAWALAEGDPALTARVDVEGARTYARRDDLELAVRYARRALQVEGIEYQTRLVSLHVLSGVLLELGQVEASWTFSEQLVALTAEAGDAYVESNTRLNALMVAMDHPRLIDVDLLEYARSSLPVAERGSNDYAVVGFRCAIADLEHDVEGLRTCILAERELEDPVGEGIALRALALQVPTREEAEALLDAAIPLAEGDRFVLAQIEHARAAVAWRFGDPEGSEAASREAVRIVLEMREGHREELARSGFSTVWRSAWEAPAARFLAAGDLPRAWAWSESMRGQEQRAGASATPVPTLAEVQRALGPREALVVYVVPTERTWSPWAWVVKPDRVETVPIDTTGLSQRVEVLLGLPHPPAAALAALREQVWAPVEPHLVGVDHVRLVADGPLHRFPVGALLTEPGDPVVARVATSEPVDGAVGPARGVRSLVAPTGTELPASRREGARWVAALGGLLIAGDAAVADALLGPETVLHVASHAQVERWVGVPSLQLADGFLDTEQVAALPLEGRVVVWAVCGGSDGPVYDAEGAFSLARAARRAGARAVVASAVPLPDGPAAEAFGALADTWAAGGRLDDAVAAVRRAHPEGGWALEVYGDGSVTAEPAPRRTGWLPWIALTMAAAGAALAWRRREG